MLARIEASSALVRSGEATMADLVVCLRRGGVIAELAAVGLSPAVTLLERVLAGANTTETRGAAHAPLTV